MIAAALSIQDPRERPADRGPRPTSCHARFKDDESDFPGYLNLWSYLASRRRELSGNQFRKRCKAEFLHYLRVREWQDLAGQLRQAAARSASCSTRRRASRSASTIAPLRAALARRPEGRRAARVPRARAARASRSSPARRWPAGRPNWVMAAELVETSRLFAPDRRARSSPQWIEPLAGHLSSAPTPSRAGTSAAAAVVATERVTLYGLPVVAGRTVAYGAIDPALSRALFIRRALVEGDWDAPARLPRGEPAARSRRSRRSRSARAGATCWSPTTCAWTSSTRACPRTSSPARHFDRWWREARAPTPTLLTYPRELLLARRRGRVDPQGAADDVAPGRAAARAHLPLRAGRARRRRHRPRAARRARRSCADVASTGSSPRCATSS